MERPGPIRRRPKWKAREGNGMKEEYRYKPRSE